MTSIQKNVAIQSYKKRIKDLEQELENERKLNAEIKARFVKCNTCTPDMKEKNNVRQGNRRFSIGCPAFWFSLFLYGCNQIAGLGTKGGSVE